MSTVSGLRDVIRDTAESNHVLYIDMWESYLEPVSTSL